MRSINLLGGLYVTEERRPLTGAATQPRRLAVLAMLAVAGERGVSREDLLTCLWPDMDEERGRHALTQSLYALRKDLDADELFLGQQELRLNPDLITSDYAQFNDAIRMNAPERAVECYRGPFLEGFHLPRADNFARWAEAEREKVAHDYDRMLDAAARRAAERGDHTAATGFLKRRAAQDPYNARVAVLLMESLAAQGAIVEALQHAKVHEQLLKQQLGLPPDPDVTAAAARLRTVPRSPGPSELVPRSPGPPEPVPRSPGPPDTQFPNALLAAAVLVAVTLLAALGLPRLRSASAREEGKPVIAVGQIADYTGRQSGRLGLPLADMLATNLARGSGLSVISSTRMLELARQLHDTGDSSLVVSSAARQAGASELVDGALYATAPTRYRLDLRRVNLASGAVIAAYKVEGPDLFALVDSVTHGLVADLGGAAPSSPLAETSTGSVEAYQAYEEGLRRYYDGDRAAAERLFARALELDSGFAQAAFYYAQSSTSGSRTESLQRLRRAVDLSPRAGDRERLVIQAEWAAINTSPALAAIAESLMIRYPGEVDGYYYAGVGATLLGNYLQAEAPFRRVIELDSLGFRNSAGRRCRVCEAYTGLAYIYFAVDSQARVRSLLREWISRQPSSAPAWRGMAEVYMSEHQPEAALTALRVADSLEPESPLNRRYLISIRSNGEDYREAERLLRAEADAGPDYVRRQAKWDLAVVLRQMGRLEEALRLAREVRLEINESVPVGAAPYNALLEGQILFEQGKYRAAAALFDSIAVGQGGGIDPSFRARDRIWAWVHEADALAQLGDTVRLRFLADSMEILGRGVAQARDRLLHAHVRGLRSRLEGRQADAADWFRRAISSPVVGFTRSNYELGGALLRLRRPAEAIGTLRSAMHGGTVGSNLYITRTDLQARLAEAFDSAGRTDSALVYYRKVLTAWESADPSFRPRRDAIQAAAGRLEARR